ncbi:carbohydrate ABC transporter permease [Salinibacterium sp. G-O1]|uniref:carbohydrate ABC transporter permease n=1 Tax=Salinibacterium sp. G-O1 TaxID=3046208 RepID=UPI0024B9BD5A|nr:carbohydrate ABC transporter permease [Salinibacterium sp. G-O1]MDJ0333888.1 carbohydrate ABC transporter permease [Salinibacterium sp. G-O1]
MKTSRTLTASKKWRGSVIALYSALILLTIPFLFPAWWMVSSSFKPLSQIMEYPPTLLPRDPTLDAYVAVFEQPFLLQYWNSLYIAVLVTLGTLAVSAMAGYAFARIRFPGVNALFLVVLLGLMLPAEVTIIPLFQLFTALDLNNTHWPLIIMPIFGASSVMGTFVMRQFFLGIPQELEDAGSMDGLNRFGIFRRIALPLARPSLAAVAILSFLASWNAFLEPLVFLSSRDKFTLPLALTQYTDSVGLPIWNVQQAAATLTVRPVLLVFVFMQRYFVQGLAQTGVKG